MKFCPFLTGWVHISKSQNTAITKRKKNLRQVNQSDDTYDSRTMSPGLLLVELLMVGQVFLQHGYYCNRWLKLSLLLKK
jgi:hypothetical protein